MSDANSEDNTDASNSVKKLTDYDAETGGKAGEEQFWMEIFFLLLFAIPITIYWIFS